MSTDKSSHVITVTTQSSAHTQALGARLGSLLKPGAVVAITGELGAGKTCFVRGIAEGLGISPAVVSSPTFVIAHDYEGPRLPLIHIDAYRLSAPRDVETIGFDQMLAERDAVIAIEWADRISSALPQDRINVSIEAVGERSRCITLECPGDSSTSCLPLYAWQGVSDSASTRRRCRVCGNVIEPDSPRAPFCSKRCQMADLGAWFTTAYSISRPAEESDIMDGPADQ